MAEYANDFVHEPSSRFRGKVCQRLGLLLFVCQLQLAVDTPLSKLPHQELQLTTTNDGVNTKADYSTPQIQDWARNFIVWWVACNLCPKGLLYKQP